MTIRFPQRLIGYPSSQHFFDLTTRCLGTVPTLRSGQFLPCAVVVLSLAKNDERAKGVRYSGKATIGKGIPKLRL
jgi:hypothetical protein